jgi:hypothetical protein
MLVSAAGTSSASKSSEATGLITHHTISLSPTVGFSSRCAEVEALRRQDHNVLRLARVFLRRFGRGVLVQSVRQLSFPAGASPRIKATPAANVGTVQAPDAETAIRTAIQQFGIKNWAHQQRLVAQRIGR